MLILSFEPYDVFDSKKLNKDLKLGKWVSQVDSQLLSDVLDRVSSHGSEHDVRYGAHLWWTLNDGVRMANSGGNDPNCGTVYGWDLLCLSNFWRTILLERQALWRTVGPFRVLAHWLVRTFFSLLFFFPNSFLYNNNNCYYYKYMYAVLFVMLIINASLVELRVFYGVI